MAIFTKDAILNLATDSNRARGALSAAVRSILESGTDAQTLAPLTDAWAIANADQQKVLRATISTVSLDVLGTRWGFKDGVLRPTEGAGGRPAATTQDKLRKFIKTEGWKATLDALYAIAQADAEAARELLAVVEVLNPKG
jgi:hypothetical protein